MKPSPPVSDQARILLLIQRADDSIRGAKPEEGLTFLLEAHEISTALAEASTQALVSALLGNLLLTLGRADEALPKLREAVATSIRSEDSLATLTQGSILASQLSNRALFSELRELAETLCDVAVYRKNWLGLADAQMMLVECDLAQRDLESAITRLITARRELHQYQAPEVAAHLLIGRMLELRHIYGAERVDPLLRNT
jgi:tetratricopeptide (TPR) repeat protein